MTEERDNSGGDRISELKDRTQNWPNLNNREKNTEKKIVQILRDLWDNTKNPACI